MLVDKNQMEMQNPHQGDSNIPMTDSEFEKSKKTFPKLNSEKSKANQILAEKSVMEGGILEINNLEMIKDAIFKVLQSNLNEGSLFYLDIKRVITSLQQKGDISERNFICPWYLVIVFLEMMEDHAVILKISGNLIGATETFSNISSNFKKVFKIILFFLENPELSMNFKNKILKKLSYNITIIIERLDDGKTKLIEFLLGKELFEDLDMLIQEAKSSENLKSYLIEEMENSIIIEIAHKIITARTMKLFNVLNYPISQKPEIKINEQEELGIKQEKKGNIIEKNNLVLENAEKSQLIKENSPLYEEKTTPSFRTLKQDIINYCVEKKMSQITRILFRKFPNEALSIHTINLALGNGCYEYLKEVSSMSRITKILIDKSIMEKIIYFLKDPHTFLDAVFFLYSIKDFVLLQETQKLLHETIKEILNDDDLSFVLLDNMNPLLIFVMLCQIFDHLSKKCFHFQHSFKKFSLFFKGVASQIVEKYDHFYNLKKLTYQIFYPARIPLIRMVFQDKDLFDSLFQDDRLAKITRLQLDSFYVFDWNILACSTMFQYATFKRSLILDTPAKIEESQVIKNLKKDPNNEIRLDIFSGIGDSIKKSLNREKEKLGCLKIFEYVSKRKIEEVNNTKNHCYQNKIYFKSIRYRTLWDAILFFSLFIYLHVNTNQYSSIRTTITQIDANYTSLMSSKKYYYQENGTYWRDTSLTQFSSSERATSHCREELNYLLGVFNGTAYVTNQTELLSYLPSCVNFHLQETKLEEVSLNLMVLCFVIIVTCCNVFIRKFYQIYVRNTFNLQLIDQLDLFGLMDALVLVLLHFFFSQKVYFSPDDLILEVNIKSIFIALLLFMFWLQMFQYIKLTLWFGYIVKTVELLIKETYEFLWIFFLFIASFASINYVLFGSFYDQFSGFFLAVRNLFGYALGGFLFLDGVSDYYVAMSAIINIIYVLYTNVILINLLIALLSSIYQKVADNSDLEYSSIIYELREEKYFDKVYGSITIYPRVINTFLFPIHIVILVCKNPGINRTIGNFGYYVSLILYISLFIALHVIVIPVSWINILVLILLNKYHDNLLTKQVTVLSKTSHIFIWFFLGIPYLCYILFSNDLGLFLKNAFFSCKTKKNETSVFSLLEYYSLKQTLKRLKNYPHKEIRSETFLKEYKKIAYNYEISNSFVYQKSKEMIISRTTELLRDIRRQDTGVGFEEFQKRMNSMEDKLKKMIEVINTFVIGENLLLKPLRSVMHSLKLQIKHSPGKNKMRELSKLEVVDYKDILDIYLKSLKEFRENK